MRKEYAQARSLAVAQAQVLNAHDELKMATSRLRLRENEDDKSIDALSLEELEQASVENSSEKFLALSTLTRIKGQLRYLKVSVFIYYKLLFSFFCVHYCIYAAEIYKDVELFIYLFCSLGFGTL